MRFTWSGVAVLFAATLAAQTVPLDVKPGLWKSITTVETSGTPPIPPDVLAKLSPEQRARLEERMKARSGAPTTQTHQHCITREDLNKPIFGKPDRQSCRETIVHSTSSEQEVHLECDNNTMKSEGTVHIEVVDPEDVKGTVKVAMSDGTHTMKVSSNITGKWQGSSCTAADNK